MRNFEKYYCKGPLSDEDRPQAKKAAFPAHEPTIEQLLARLRGTDLGLTAASAVRSTPTVAKPLASGRTTLERLPAEPGFGGQDLFQPQAAQAAPRIPTAAQIPDPLTELLMLGLRGTLPDRSNAQPMAAKEPDKAAVIPYFDNPRARRPDELISSIIESSFEVDSRLVQRVAEARARSREKIYPQSGNLKNFENLNSKIEIPEKNL